MLSLFMIGQAAGKEPAAPASVDTEMRVTTIHGKKIQPFKCVDPPVRAAVVLFVTTDCPIANRYAPEIEKIRAEYEPKGARMTLVHVDPGLSNQEANRHASAYALQAPVVMDRKHELVSATGARITPEAFVIDRSGKICYRGRINDQFAGYGERRAEPRTHDLRNAIDAVLEGRTVKNPVTTPIGCLIPDLP